MSKIPLTQVSRYLDFLPVLYQEGKESTEFAGRFLKVFEKILTGIEDDLSIGMTGNGESAGYDTTRSPVEITGNNLPGIEQTIDALSGFFDPDQTPVEFLKWLAGWVALVLRDDWKDKDSLRKPLFRRLLKRIVPLYRKRGTKEGITEYLKIFVGDNLQIDENITGIRIGPQTGPDRGIATIGRDTFIGGFLPHFFIVKILFKRISTEDEINYLRNSVTATRGVLDLEKPAHTYYSLQLEVPGIYVQRRPPATDAAGTITTYDNTQVGKNTVIGKAYPFFV